MTERSLFWMNERYPEGFFCCDLDRFPMSASSWAEIVSLECPLLIHLKTTALQDCITALIDAGASAATDCYALSGSVIRGTLGDIALRIRASNVSEIDFVVEA